MRNSGVSVLLLWDCVRTTWFPWLTCPADETGEVALVYIWDDPLLHFCSQTITQPNCGAGSPGTGPMLFCHLSHDLRLSIICSLKQQIGSDSLQRVRPMLGAELNQVKTHYHTLQRPLMVFRGFVQPKNIAQLTQWPLAPHPVSTLPSPWGNFADTSGMNIDLLRTKALCVVSV